jgi:hypothetical protein
MRHLASFLLLLVSLPLCAACTSGPPPFTRAPGVVASPDPGTATLVVLWPSTSCDPGGYVTLVTADGHFLGNVGPGAQLRTTVPAGETTVLAWNQLMEESGAGVERLTVPVVRGRLARGLTYYVRVAEGEWDEGGPRELRSWRSGARVCAMTPGRAMTSALEAVTASTAPPGQLAAWTAELRTLVPDRDAGQAWLDARREVVEIHRSLALQRYDRLRPQGRRMATLEPGDGVPASP